MNTDEIQTSTVEVSMTIVTDENRPADARYEARNIAQIHMPQCLLKDFRIKKTYSTDKGHDVKVASYIDMPVQARGIQITQVGSPKVKRDTKEDTEGV